jgi:hypothetical protein
LHARELFNLGKLAQEVEQFKLSPENNSSILRGQDGNLYSRKRKLYERKRKKEGRGKKVQRKTRGRDRRKEIGNKQEWEKYREQIGKDGVDFKKMEGRGSRREKEMKYKKTEKGDKGGEEERIERKERTGKVLKKEGSKRKVIMTREREGRRKMLRYVEERNLKLTYRKTY